MAQQLVSGINKKIYMIVSINFADKSFRKQQFWNSKTATILGGIDKVTEYSPEDIDPSLLKQNEEMIEGSKGFGYYFWKPYLIKETLKTLNTGDYLVYADSGAVFLKSVKPILRYMETKGADIIGFRLPLIEKQWTKRDTFVLMDADTPKYTDSPQITANFFILKKSEQTKEFIDKYWAYCSDRTLIDVKPNKMGLDNYPEFIEHRFDQSVFSLLCKKEKILVEGDLSDYGVFPYQYIHNKSYIYNEAALNSDNNRFKGTILANRKMHPVVYGIKFYIRLVLNRLGFNKFVKPKHLLE